MRFLGVMEKMSFFFKECGEFAVRFFFFFLSVGKEYYGRRKF